MCDHEVHLLCRAILRSDDYVPFIFSIFIITDYDWAPLLSLSDRFLNTYVNSLVGGGRVIWHPSRPLSASVDDPVVLQSLAA